MAQQEWPSENSTHLIKLLFVCLFVDPLYLSLLNDPCALEHLNGQMSCYTINWTFFSDFPSSLFLLVLLLLSIFWQLTCTSTWYNKQIPKSIYPIIIQTLWEQTHALKAITSFHNKNLKLKINISFRGKTTDVIYIHTVRMVYIGMFYFANENGFYLTQFTFLFSALPCSYSYWPYLLYGC